MASQEQRAESRAVLLAMVDALCREDEEALESVKARANALTDALGLPCHFRRSAGGQPAVGG